ncbi:hypothetical protein MLD38_029436 [Melastoma candidum]|uniref:Uncharacterized protein n=1 Tax=Melastoma candidum TaxID=119954 RepID=A0ACB9N803_9MYRT|nr:hypothetical protein MLD38_029436 [Melastoma candidum]
MRRRRAASDDEEDRVATDGGPREDEGERDRVKRVVRVQSDESEGEGAAPEYDEDEDEEEDYYLEEDYGEGEVGYHEDGVEVVDSRPLAVHNDRVIDEGSTGNVEGSAREEAGGLSAVKDVAGEWGQDRGEEEEEENPMGKKENEPFAVPTAGHLSVFLCHFKWGVDGFLTLSNLVGNPRTFGGRKLWESKDNRKWGHDKYEEMTIQERRNDERRRGKEFYRGRGRNRAMDRDYLGGYGAKSYDNNQNIAIINTKNQNHVARSVRGKEPRRKSAEESSQENAGQSVISSTNKESDAAPARMQTFASSLNSASPPFYPSSSSSKDGSSAQRKDVQLGAASQINRCTVVDDSISASANSYGVVDADFPTDSSKLSGALVPKGKSTNQGSRRDSVIYGGPPVLGSGGNAGGDQNFPGTPAFLPVMQFGRQHPGGLGLPAVGMAFPGYVAQPQLGMGNSKMTWLPVLTGGAGD